MRFEELEIPGVFLLTPDLHFDERGFFGRLFCDIDFPTNGVHFKPVQINISHSSSKHTLRGMHYQRSPYEEEKVVCCVRGSLYDVVVDLREGSDTLYRWIGVELAEQKHSMLYVPKGFAHGFLTLEPDTEVLYMMGEYYQPGYAGGVRYDDPKLGIKWPVAVPSTIAPKDLQFGFLP